MTNGGASEINEVITKVNSDDNCKALVLHVVAAATSSAQYEYTIDQM